MKKKKTTIMEEEDKNGEELMESKPETPALPERDYSNLSNLRPNWKQIMEEKPVEE